MTEPLLVIDVQGPGRRYPPRPKRAGADSTYNGESPVAGAALSRLL